MIRQSQLPNPSRSPAGPLLAVVPTSAFRAGVDVVVRPKADLRPYAGEHNQTAIAAGKRRWDREARRADEIDVMTQA